jgi:hypothetical protein
MRLHRQRTTDRWYSVLHGGECTNQAKPLLPRFSADFAVPRIHTMRLNRAL